MGLQTPTVMQPIPYTNLRVAEGKREMIAQMRRKRLNKAPNAWGAAIFMDLLWGAGPWLAGVCAVAVGLWRLHDTVDGVPETFKHFNSDVAISAISTFSAFLLVSRIQGNLGSNRNIIDQFGNLTGSVINLSLWVKSQMVSTKTAAALMPLPDGSGSTYLANKIGLTLASVPYIVKYGGRGTKIMPEGLPIGQDQQLVDRYKEFTAGSMFGSSGGLAPFAAIVLMISEQIDQVQRGEKASEYAVLFAQLNAVTGAEGAIGGVSAYIAPYIMTALTYALVVSLPAPRARLRPHPQQRRQLDLDRRGDGLLHDRLLPDQRALRQPHGAAQQAERPGAAHLADVRLHREGHPRRLLAHKPVHQHQGPGAGGGAATGARELPDAVQLRRARGLNS